ncbi:MAG: hypothetical protein KAH26_11635 [Bacteroidales bacterium]|nr:hypothetical protein [Bacteroidales bacterium]
MKKLIFISIFLLSGFTPQAQINDLDLVNMLIGKNIEDLDSILTSTGYDYTITSKKDNYEGVSTKLDIYIDSQFGGVKLWELETQEYIGMATYTPDGYISGKIDYVSAIFVRYRHSNLGDLKDFKSYEIPKNDTIEYEKELGERLSHLKVKYLKEDK